MGGKRYYQTTAFGFRYGSAEVVRQSINHETGDVMIGIVAFKQKPPISIQIHVTKSGEIIVLRDGPKENE